MVNHQPNCDEQTKAQERIDAIDPLIELLEMPKAQRFPHLLPDGKRARTLIAVIEYCAARSGRSVATVWRWLRLFREGGKDAMLWRGRKDKGNSRFFRQHRKAAAFAAYLRLTWGLSFRAIYKTMTSNRRLIGIRIGEMPCSKTVRAWLGSAPEVVLPLALEGQKMYRERIYSLAKRGLLKLRKDWTV